MSDQRFIRTLYHPLQPTENSSGRGKLFYKEYLPGFVLQPYVHCFWELKTSGPLTNTYFYRVVSDGCIDLVVNCQSFEGLIVAGVSGNALDIPVQNPSSYFGIRFLPAGINQFGKFPVSEIQNQMLNIANIKGKDWNELATLLFEKPNTTERIRQAESFLATQLSKNNTSMHPALAHAMHHILTSGGDIPIQKKAAAWISPRQLQRLFHEYIGCPPKVFARIVRFQKTLYNMSDGKPGQKKYAFYDHGYTDQAHFIREFRLLYGDTPGILKKMNEPAILHG